MLVSLPTKNGNIDFELDTSAYADYRFEVHFSEQVKCSFQEFLKRTANAGPKANYLNALKILYCYLESDKAPTFKRFTKLFTPEHAEGILTKLAEVFEQVFNSAIKN